MKQSWMRILLLGLAGTAAPLSLAYPKYQAILLAVAGFLAGIATPTPGKTGLPDPKP